MGPSGLFFSIAILILLSTFFSLSETAITSVQEEKIFKMKQDGVIRAKSAMKILENKEKIISIALLCDNLVNIAASSLSAVFFAQLFGEFDEIGILLSTIIMTILIFVFGEVLPKMIALRQATKVTLIISPLFLLLWKILYPIIWVINILTTFLVSLLHIKNENDAENADSSILGAVEMYHQRGMLQTNEKQMLSGVLHLDEIDMKDIMTHRSDMFAIDVNENIEAIIDKVFSTKFTKIPVYDKSDDNIIGYIKSMELIKEVHKNKDNLSRIDIKKLLLKPWFLPGDSSIGKHLQEFKDNGNSIAFVVDEFGGLMGIATLEDLLEEIVGDIRNTENRNNFEIIKTKDGSFIVRADMNLLNLNEKIGSSFEDKEVSTIGGFLLNKIDKIPTKGEIFNIDGYKFAILDATATNIEKISILKIENNNLDDFVEKQEENAKK